MGDPPATYGWPMSDRYPDIKRLRAPRQGAEPLNVENLMAVAAAAGHGLDHRGIPAPEWWFDISEEGGNVRPVYDARFVQTFNPQVVVHLLHRLIAAEDTLAANGLSVPDPETHRIATLHAQRADEQAAQDAAQDAASLHALADGLDLTDGDDRAALRERVQRLFAHGRLSALQAAVVTLGGSSRHYASRQAAERTVSELIIEQAASRAQ